MKKVTLLATLINVSFTQTGSKMFTYRVEGEKDALAAFHDAQATGAVAQKRGKALVSEDQDGNAIWNTFRAEGETCKLTITQNKSVVPDNQQKLLNESLEFDALERQEMARLSAQAKHDRQFANITRSVVPTVTMAPINTPAAAPTVGAPKI